MVKLLLVGVTAGLVLPAAPTRALPTRSATSSCRRGAVRALINATHVCLSTGAPCKTSYQRQYAKYSFYCDSGLLARQRRKTIPPPAPIPPPATTTPVPPGSGSQQPQPSPFTGTWWSIDSSDGSLQHITFGSGGTLDYEDDSAHVCGGVAGYATTTGVATGNTWTATARTSLLCPDNDGSVPDVLFQFTLNPNGTLSGSVGPDSWTRTHP